MNNENQENYTTPYNEWLSTYYSGSKQDFKEPLHFPDYPPAHNPIQELINENIKLSEENKKLKETIRILNEKLSKAHKQINRHIEDSYNDATQNDR